MERTKQLKIYIKPELHKRIKIEAAAQGRSITDLMEEILERELEKLPKRYVYHKNSRAGRLIFFAIFYFRFQFFNGFLQDLT